MKSLRLHKSDLEDDIAAYQVERLPFLRVETVFDVGANIGWFTWQFSRVYPDSHYYLFEPVAPIALEMHANLERLGIRDVLDIHIHELALGSAPGQALATSIPNCTINHIVKPCEDISLLTPSGNIPTGIICVDTGDTFCELNGIRKIDYLKIDCEGHDIEVLRGFSGMLSSGKVMFVQVECKLGGTNEFSIGCSFEEVDTMLHGMGYCSFRFINQASNFLPCLSRADVVWILQSYAEELADKHGT
jgi:FkbM family methyltransferase